VLDSELTAIVDAIATTMFDAQLQPVAHEDAHFEASAVSASIALSGAFCGVLRATFSEPLARALAGTMMAQEPAESTPDDLRDVTGELVNIVAGNLKAVLPSPCQLSLPQVQDALTHSADAFAPIGTASFELMGQSLRVELFAVHAF
jgi:chemotaxis protein CheX